LLIKYYIADRNQRGEPEEKVMGYKRGNRGQLALFPISIEEYVGREDLVRAYDAMIEAMDLERLGLVLEHKKVGNSPYDPVSMLKLLVYGYSYGVRSSRKLERECHYNVSFMWLMGGLKPDHKTIAEFRRNNTKVLKGVLKQSAEISLKLGLIEGNTLFVDSSKVRGNASIKKSWTKKKCDEVLKKLDQRIVEIIKESEEVDASEQHLGSLVKLSDELRSVEKLKSDIVDIVRELDESKKKSLNTTDKDCTRINSVRGSNAGYSVQSVVDEKHGLIVNVDATSENNDIDQLSNQLEQAHDVLGKSCSTACADSGYSSVDELERVEKKGIKVVVPSQRQASKKERGTFDISRFQYDPEKDCFICPVNQVLEFFERRDQSNYYKAKGAVCRACPHYGNCTKAKDGRRVGRLIKEDLRLRFEEEFKEPKSQAVYKLRKQKVELPFGHIKKNLKLDAFLLRGSSGVNAEASLLAACFNIVRMVRILGISNFQKALATA
jgi:transposase